MNETKIKGGCQSGRKVVSHDSKSDLPLVKGDVYFLFGLESFSSLGCSPIMTKNKSGYYDRALTSIRSVKVCKMVSNYIFMGNQIRWDAQPSHYYLPKKIQ